MMKQESVICKQCEQEIEDGAFLLKVGEEFCCEKLKGMRFIRYY